MSGAHTKKEMVTGEKPVTSHGKAPLGESRNKGKEKESPSHKSHRSGEKKKFNCKIRGVTVMVDRNGGILQALIVSAQADWIRA